jgi:hypothetical protein
VVAAEATLATGTAEREAAAALSEQLPEARRSAPTMNYDVQAFVQGLKARGIEAHVAINGTVSKNGKDAQDRRPERGRGEPALCDQPAAAQAH